MTYGRVNAGLRAALVNLLVIRGVNAQLTPAHKNPAKALEKAEANAALAQRYRTAVWTYVHRLATIAVPDEFLTPAWSPVRQLAALTAPVSRDDGEFAGPSTAELGAQQRIPVLEAWRRAAVAAVVGAERDVLGMDTRLDVGRRLVLARDVADVPLAIAILDQRYRDVSGWTPSTAPAPATTSDATTATPPRSSPPGRARRHPTRGTRSTGSDGDRRGDQGRPIGATPPNARSPRCATPRPNSDARCRPPAP